MPNNRVDVLEKCAVECLRLCEWAYKYLEIEPLSTQCGSQVITLLLHIPEVPSSNLVQEIALLTAFFRDFPHSIQAS